MKRLAGLFWSLLFLAVPIFGVITFAVAPAYDIWLPKDVSEHGASVDGLFYFILWLTGVVFVVTEIALFGLYGSTMQIIKRLKLSIDTAATF